LLALVVECRENGDAVILKREVTLPQDFLRLYGEGGVVKAHTGHMRYIRMGSTRGRIRALHQIERISPLAQAEEYATVHRVLFQHVHSKQLRIKSFGALDVGDPKHKVAQTFYWNHCMNLRRGKSRPNILFRVTLLAKILTAGSNLIYYIFKLD
jgi:hypothetical protein